MSSEQSLGETVKETGLGEKTLKVDMGTSKGN
jgi:hypothetical protein